MATTETRPSFRLPWTAGTGESGDPSESPTEEPVAQDDGSVDHEIQGPELHVHGAQTPAPAQPDPPSPAPVRRATKFMADLTRAMQAAADQARSETMTRFDAEAKAFVEEIRSGTTSDVADLRRKADDDMASIRERSKAEIARIREQTEASVADRKTELEAEMEAHAAMREARAERVAVVVAAFEAEMADFFERLNAEEDPTRIATMAETMPDPPSLEDLASSSVAATAPAPPEPDPVPTIALDELARAVAGSTRVAADPERAAAPLAEVEIDFAAAEAEAASFDGDLKELGDDDELGAQDRTAEDNESAQQAAAAAVAERMREIEPADAAPDVPTSTRLVVTGLVSVASIANFKRSLARIVGVQSIGVASGPSGEFVFTVSHDPGLPFATAIMSMMPSFESQVIGTSDGEIQLESRERDGD
jgi:hypothetical protein